MKHQPDLTFHIYIKINCYMYLDLTRPKLSCMITFTLHFLMHQSIYHPWSRVKVIFQYYLLTYWQLWEPWKHLVTSSENFSWIASKTIDHLIVQHSTQWVESICMYTQRGWDRCFPLSFSLALWVWMFDLCGISIFEPSLFAPRF